jgi:hypothetical protein
MYKKKIDHVFKLFSHLEKYKGRVFGSCVREFVCCQQDPEFFIIKGLQNIGDIDIFFNSEEEREGFIKSFFGDSPRNFLRRGYKTYCGKLHRIRIDYAYKNYHIALDLVVDISEGSFFEKTAGDCDINSLIGYPCEKNLITNIHSRDPSLKMRNITYNIMHKMFLPFGGNMLKDYSDGQHHCVTRGIRHARYAKLLKKLYDPDHDNMETCENEECLFHVRYSDFGVKVSLGYLPQNRSSDPIPLPVEESSSSDSLPDELSEEDYEGIFQLFELDDVPGDLENLVD